MVYDSPLHKFFLLGGNQTSHEKEQLAIPLIYGYLLSAAWAIAEDGN